MEPRWRASDGTPLHYPAGTLEVDEIDDMVRSHVCGLWFRHVGTQARFSHDLSADEYKALASLNRSTSLVAPGIQRRLASVMRSRIKTDKRIRRGMAKGRALARAGVLQEAAADAHDSMEPRLARRHERERTGSALGTRRAQHSRAVRETRAQALGFDSLEAYLWQRYYHEDGRIEDLMADLGATWSSVRGDLDRLGIPIRPRGRRRRS
jgi:hypothetical protein